MTRQQDEAVRETYTAAEYAYFAALVLTVGDPSFTEAVQNRRSRRPPLPDPSPDGGDADAVNGREAGPRGGSGPGRRREGASHGCGSAECTSRSPRWGPAIGWGCGCRAVRSPARAACRSTRGIPPAGPSWRSSRWSGCGATPSPPARTASRSVGGSRGPGACAHRAAAPDRREPARGGGGGRDHDLLLFTGFELDELEPAQLGATRLADVVITGRYRAAEPTDLIWRGSANQRMHLNTDLGRRRYAEFVDLAPQRPPIQVRPEHDGFWLIGVPRRGTLQILERGLRRGGLPVSAVTWRSEAAVRTTRPSAG